MCTRFTDAPLSESDLLCLFLAYVAVEQYQPRDVHEFSGGFLHQMVLEMNGLPGVETEDKIWTALERGYELATRYASERRSREAPSTKETPSS